MNAIKYNEDNELEEAIFSAINVTRWTKNDDRIYPVLTRDETEEVIQNVFTELEKAGFKIVFER